MRLGIAVEVEVSDELDPAALGVASYVTFLADRGTYACRVVRIEVHPDPAAVFADEVDSGT